MRDNPVVTTKGREGIQASPSGSGSNAPNKNQFYAPKTHGD